MAGRDTLALLPTGGGKSICFQVPAMAMEGVCIVISPLIALMNDQVQNLKKRGIPAIAINSSLSKTEIDHALDNAIYGNTKFIYLSPERLKSDIVLARLAKMKVSLIAVDEAHCISEWGHEFRPAYREIAEIRELLPQAPIIALTATATPDVELDIVEKLALREPQIFKKSFVRNNLIYVVAEETNKLSRMLNIIKKLGGSGIVYASTRKETLRQARLLRGNGISAIAYHGGMDYKARNEAQALWVANKAQVVVATNAFGMGIDKPDVRFVIHINLPPSVEAYFQEAGRGGRDGKTAYAIYLKDQYDVADLQQRVQAMIPEKIDIMRTYRALTNYFQLALGSKMGEPAPFDIKAFAKKYDLPAITTYHCLKILEYFEYISLTEAVFSPSKLQIRVGSQALYSFEVGHPKFENLLQLLLRSYEGLFDQYVRINENNIGVRLKLSAASVKEQLNYLQELRILRYEEQTDLPFISFPNERITPDALQLDKEYMRLREQRNRARMEAMVGYTANGLVCRSRQLVAYFGESKSTDCGRCDVCLRTKGLTSLNGLQVEIKAALNEALAEGPEELGHSPTAF